MKKVIAVLCLLFALQGSAQVNLVPNPSFELYDTCPQGPSKIWYATGWFQPSNGTSDYFNSCFDSLQPWISVMDVPLNAFGHQEALSGAGYAGLFAAYPEYSLSPFREYVEIRLISPLVSGQKYYVSFWVSLSDSSNYATDDIGICFTYDSLLNDTTYILYGTSQVQNPSGNFLNSKSVWTMITGQYVANGGEEFITVGNFKDNASTDTVHVLGGGDSSVGSIWNTAYYFIDDVCISTDSLLCTTNTSIDESRTLELEIFPNPASYYINITITSPLELVTIYDNVGQSVYSESHVDVGLYTLDVSSLATGIYFVQAISNAQIVNQQFTIER